MLAPLTRARPPVVALPSEPSAKADLEAEWQAVLVTCRAFLVEHGPLLPRFVKLYGNDGLTEPDDCFRSGSTAPATILGYLKGAKCLVAWAMAVGCEFSTMGEFDVASYLKDQCARGPSVPLGAYRSCIWMEKAFDICPYHRGYGYLPVQPLPHCSRC